MTDTNVDLVVLGGGSAGYAAALRAAELGSKVVLVEKDKLGGTCLHWGCIPTKTLLHAAEVADEAREAAVDRREGQFDGVDMPACTSTRTASSTGTGRASPGWSSRAASPSSRARAGSSARHRWWSATTATSAPTSCWPPAPTRARCPG